MVGRLSEAAAEFRSVLDRQPDHAIAMGCLALVRFQLIFPEGWVGRGKGLPISGLLIGTRPTQRLLNILRGDPLSLPKLSNHCSVDKQFS